MKLLTLDLKTGFKLSTLLNAGVRKIAPRSGSGFGLGLVLELGLGAIFLEPLMYTEL